MKRNGRKGRNRKKKEVLWRLKAEKRRSALSRKTRSIAMIRMHATVLVTVLVGPSVRRLVRRSFWQWWNAGILTFLPLLKNAKKKLWKAERPMDRPTDGSSDTVTYRIACTRLKMNMAPSSDLMMQFVVFTVCTVFCDFSPTLSLTFWQSFFEYHIKFQNKIHTEFHNWM